MVDVNNLRKKFPGKDPKRTKHRAAIKAIAREYERKRAELGARAPDVKRGFPYYMVILIGMLLVGALVIPQILEHGPVGPGQAERNLEKARKGVRNLAIALGRFRYHVGRYPTDEEGLEIVARRLDRPELRRVPVPGWNGPYISQLLPDPWRNDFVYVNNGEAATPTLYSKGPDGAAGTTDDVIADPSDFDEPFRDTSWAKGWLPQHLRGYVVAQDERHRVDLEEQIAEIQGPDTNAVPESLKVDCETLAFEVLSLDETSVRMRATYMTRGGEPSTNEFTAAMPIPWTPERPFLHHVDLAGETFAYPVRTLKMEEDGTVVLNGAPFSARAVALAASEGSKDDPFSGIDALRYRLMKFKDLGANAVCRAPSSHSARLLCDQLGLLAIDGDVPGAASEDSLLDGLGRERASFWDLRARWNRDAGTIRLSPSWTGEEGEAKRVVCATDCDEAELFVNNVSQGRRKKPDFSWDVKFEAGSIKAIVYDGGRYVGETESLTPGPAVSLSAVADRLRLAVGDIAFVRVFAIDSDGIEVESGVAPAFSFAVEGPGEIAGVRSEGASSLVAVRRTGGSGLAVVFNVRSQGLGSATVKFPLERSTDGGLK